MFLTLIWLHTRGIQLNELQTELTSTWPSQTWGYVPANYDWKATKAVDKLIITSVMWYHLNLKYSWVTVMYSTPDGVL